LVLFRRCPEHPDEPSFISYYQVLPPSGTSVETMIGVVAQRWRIEECFQFTKDQLGLGDYEVLLDGLASHTALVFAEAFLSVLRYQVEPLGELSTPPFFLLRLGWLSGCVPVPGPRPAQSCRVEAMGLRLLPRSWS